MENFLKFIKKYILGFSIIRVIILLIIAFTLLFTWAWYQGVKEERLYEKETREFCQSEENNLTIESTYMDVISYTSACGDETIKDFCELIIETDGEFQNPELSLIKTFSCNKYH